VARVIDCFMLRDELDMLEGRFRELDPIVDSFVLVEAPVDHKGNPKPLHFAENADRFEPWAHKIVHVVADGLPPSMTPWRREHAQRDAARPALEAIASDDDVILVSDVDEFPPRGFDFSEVQPVVSFSQRLAMYAVDLIYPEPHVCTVAARWSALKGKSIAAVRDNRYAYPQVSGGWHLTWLGGPEGQRAKLAVTCHDEMTALSRELLASGECYTEGIHHTGDFYMNKVDVDETWPAFIWERQCPQTWYRPR